LPGIGFEWQFASDVMRLMDTRGKTPAQTRPPSKSVAFRWSDPGVTIESDDGEVEIVTDLVRTWPALRNQLVLIGELITALTGTPPDLDSMTNQALARDLAGAGLNQYLVNRSSSGRSRGSAVGREDRLLAFAEGHLKPVDVQPGQGLPLLTRSTSGRALIEFPVPGNIIESAEVRQNQELPRNVLFAKGELIAVEYGSTSPRGVAQGTIDRKLAEVPDVLARVGSAATAQASAVLKPVLPRGHSPSPELLGFVAVLYYYLERFSDRRMKKSTDGPKAWFFALPRMNLRSVYCHLLSEADRSAFHELVNGLSPAEANQRACPRAYVGGSSWENPLTVGEWFTSILRGDAPAAPVTADDDYAGIGPRGADHDKMSPPCGYPAHVNPGRASAWFTYAMGRTSAIAADSPFVCDFRDVMSFGEQTDRLRYEDFVAMAANLSAYAGLTNVPGH